MFEIGDDKIGIIVLYIVKFCYLGSCLINLYYCVDIICKCDVLEILYFNGVILI